MEVHSAADVAGEPAATVRPTNASCESIEDVSGSQVLGRIRLLRAAALLGAAHAAYDLTKAYVSTREQFGAPLLKIPAVGANLAVMQTELIQADAGLRRALVTGDNLDAASAQVARLMAGRCADRVATLAHQLHGAMGVTEEYPLHRLTRRIWAWLDADLPDRYEAISPGTQAVSGGEANFWEVLTG
ncbi:acyl-CoA dehydrogenase family protein [Leekyejoonella antrihumi]|uniref:acyl-CoA dehydrogenase family protein n=1 Tax=Leekyejoonella antrihumi TaxID=1660198 RepID=UPI0016468C6F|nr:acyl-CoA dehydrogenase family protein [Leekyejoonella antrihumi]